jgi:hypothetical protein
MGFGKVSRWSLARGTFGVGSTRIAVYKINEKK